MTEPKLPSKEEFGQWRRSPVGEWFFAYLQAKFNTEAELLVYGGTVNLSSSAETSMQTARHAAIAQTLHEVGVLVNYDYICNELGISKEDDNDETTGPSGSDGIN